VVLRLVVEPEDQIRWVFGYWEHPNLVIEPNELDGSLDVANQLIQNLIVYLGLLRFRQGRVKSAKSDEQAAFVDLLAVLGHGVTVVHPLEHWGLQGFSQWTLRLWIHWLLAHSTVTFLDRVSNGLNPSLGFPLLSELLNFFFLQDRALG